MLGGAFALIDRVFLSVPFLLALLASMLIQAGTNLFNDYFDHKSGADSSESMLPCGVIQAGLLTPNQVYRGALVCYGLALLPLMYLAARIGMEVMWFGLLGLLLGYFYTGGPFPFAYRALGEFVVIFALGPLLALSVYYVQVGIVQWDVFWGAIPVGILAAAVTHVNNLRDREHDASVGKITLANLLSDKAAKLEMTFLVFAAYLLQIVLAAVHIVPRLSLITLLSLPLALTVVRRTWTSTSVLEMNLVLGLTVLLHLLYGMAYTLGLFSSVLLS
jgi:1,4-dihydroxy-2-naphthoate octaprenyltransferase